LKDGKEESLDAWVQYQAKMKHSSDTKYDVKVNGSGITPQTSHQGRLKLKEGYGQKWHGRARQHGDPVPNCCPGKPKVPF